MLLILSHLNDFYPQKMTQNLNQIDLTTFTISENIRETIHSATFIVTHFRKKVLVDNGVQLETVAATTKTKLC